MVVLVGQLAAGHGFEHGDALAHVAALGVARLLALVYEQLRDAQQLYGHAPHQVRQRLLQPQHSAQHLDTHTHPFIYYCPNRI